MKELREKEAKEILADKIKELRAKPYQELVATYLNKPEAFEVTGRSGTIRQLEIEAFWDDPREKKNLRVTVTIDAGGGWRVFAPMIAGDFIISPGGSFVGE